MGLTEVTPMKIESPSFTTADLKGFLRETVDHERTQLADRLERISARLADAVALTPPGAGPRPDRWDANDVLAHMVMVSKFYGVLVKRVGSGDVTEIDLMSFLQARDPAVQPLTSLPASELVERARREQRRTIEYLRGADAATMLRRVKLFEGTSMSALELAQLPLCAHLEIHIEQYLASAN